MCNPITYHGFITNKLYSIEQFIHRSKGDVTALRKSESDVPISHKDVVHESSPMGTYHNVRVCSKKITVFVQCTYEGAIENANVREVSCFGDSVDMQYCTGQGKEKDLNRNIAQ